MEVSLTFIDSHEDTSGWSRFDPSILDELGEIAVNGNLIYQDDEWHVLAVAVRGEWSLGRLSVPNVAILRCSRCGSPQAGRS